MLMYHIYRGYYSSMFIIVSIKLTLLSVLDMFFVCCIIIKCCEVFKTNCYNTVIVWGLFVLGEKLTIASKCPPTRMNLATIEINVVVQG